MKFLTPDNLANLFYYVFYAILLFLGSKEAKKWFKSFIKRFRPHDAKIRLQIRQEAYDLLHKLEAHLEQNIRVNVWQFTNGTSSSAGYSYRYSQLIVEAVNQLRPVLKLFEKHIIEDIIEHVVEIQESDHYLMRNVREDILPGVRGVYEQMGIKQAIDFKFNNKDVYEGVLSIGFTELIDFDIEKEIEVTRMIETAASNIYNLIKGMK